MFRIALFACAWLAAADAAAMDLPHRDVEAGCRAAFSSIQQGDPNISAYVTNCIEHEQQAYDQAKLLWPQLSDARQQECTGYLANLPGPLFYEALLICVKNRLAPER